MEAVFFIYALMIVGMGLFFLYILNNGMWEITKALQEIKKILEEKK